MGARGDALDGLVDAGVHAHREAVAAGVDGVDQAVQFGCAVAQHMQDGAELLAAELGQRTDLDDRRRDEGAVRARGRQRQAGDARAAGLHRGDVRFQAGARLGVDDRADVHAHVRRVAQAQFGERAAQHVQHAVGDVLLQAQHAQRRAALAGGVEGGGEHVRHHLLGQRGGVHDHRVLAAGLCDQRHVAAARGELAVDQRGDFGGAGEHHSEHARIRHQRGADGLAAAGQQLQRGGRDAGLVQQAHRAGGDQRGLLGRLGEHRVAGGERGGDLAGEDREREVPRADAQHRAERHVAGGIERTRLLGVVAQEIHRLAQLGDRVGPGLAGFTHGEREQAVGFALEQRRRALQAFAARRGRRGGPFGRGGVGGGERVLDVLGARFGDAADELAAVGRVGDRGHLRRHRAAAGDDRPGGEGRGARSGQRGGDARAHRLAGEVDARGVGAECAEQIGRQCDPRMRRAGERGGLFDRVGDQLLDRHALVHDAVDEAGVGAVLEQPAHQVGEQGLVAAHRGVDAHQAVAVGAADDLVVERLAHAVQTLELVVARLPGAAVGGGEVEDRRQRMGVVGGELRIDDVARGEQLPRAGEVGDVGVDLARVDRVAGQAVDLRALDLGVPVGALDQAHHHALAAAPRQVDDEVEHIGCALLVGLHHEAQPGPAGERVVERERLKQVERDVQPVGLLGVDVEADVVALGLQAQGLQLRQQFAQHALALRPGVARVQGRELHRDAVAVDHAAAPRGHADRLDGALVVAEVALGIHRGHRRLAEHVEGVAVALLLVLAAAPEGLVDVAAGDELLAEHAHRQVHALADQRLAAARDQAGERRGQALGAAGRHQPAGDQQAPGRGVDEQRGAVADVRAPVAVGELVADQAVGGGLVGHAQQGLGQAHQRHALLAGERELLHQRVDTRGARAGGAQAGDELVGERAHRLAQGLGKARGLDQGRDTDRLGRAPGGVDRAAQRVTRRGGQGGRGGIGRHWAGCVRQHVRGHGRALLGRYGRPTRGGGEGRRRAEGRSACEVARSAEFFAKRRS